MIRPNAAMQRYNDINEHEFLLIKEIHNIDTGSA